MSGGRSRLLLGGIAIAAAVSLLALVTPSADSAATPLSALTQPSTVAIVPTSTATATNQRPRARLYVQGDSLTIISFAHERTAETSVGLNASAVLNDRTR